MNDRDTDLAWECRENDISINGKTWVLQSSFSFAIPFIFFFFSGR